jgi:hypothetical protein
MGDMGGQIDKMVSFIQFEAKNKREEILAKAKQDKEAKKLEVVHREKLKIDADFNKRIKNVDTQTKMCAPGPFPPFTTPALGERGRCCNRPARRGERGAMCTWRRAAGGGGRARPRGDSMRSIRGGSLAGPGRAVAGSCYHRGSMRGWGGGEARGGQGGPPRPTDPGCGWARLSARSKLSKMQGEMRMTVLTEADQVVNQMKAAAREEIAKIAQNAAAYKQLLEDLIVEVCAPVLHLAGLHLSAARVQGVQRGSSDPPPQPCDLDPTCAAVLVRARHRPADQCCTCAAACSPARRP